MPENWFKIGAEWMKRHDTLRHGDVVRETARFAKSLDLGPNTIRGYRAAVLFITQLRTEGAIDDEQLRRLSSQPIKSINVLHRVAHRGGGQLGPLLMRVVGDNPLTRSELEAEEARIRRDEGRATVRPSTQSAEANAHSFRLRAGQFRVDGIAAWLREMKSRHRAVAIPALAKELAPLAVDAVAMGPDGSFALRVVAETSAETKIRPRLGEAFVGALATARIFHSVLLLTQSPEDAETLGELTRRIAGCGVGVAWLSPRRIINGVAEPERTTPPDLGQLITVVTRPLPS